MNKWKYWVITRWVYWLSILLCIVSIYELGRLRERSLSVSEPHPIPGQMCKPVIHKEWRDVNLVKDCHGLVSDKDHCEFVSWAAFNKEVGFLKDRASLRNSDRIIQETGLASK